MPIGQLYTTLGAILVTKSFAEKTVTSRTTLVPKNNNNDTSDNNKKYYDEHIFTDIKWDRVGIIAHPSRNNPTAQKK